MFRNFLWSICECHQIILILNKLIKKKPLGNSRFTFTFGTNRDSKLPFIKLGCVPSLIYAGFLYFLFRCLELYINIKFTSQRSDHPVKNK